VTKKSEAMRKTQIPPFKHKNRKIKMIPQAPFKFLFKPFVLLIAISFFIITSYLLFRPSVLYGFSFVNYQEKKINQKEVNLNVLDERVEIHHRKQQ
jgi:quinol-cytochrome oxidoreductase complex cytochrome b subunit